MALLIRDRIRPAVIVGLAIAAATAGAVYLYGFSGLAGPANGSDTSPLAVHCGGLDEQSIVPDVQTARLPAMPPAPRVLFVGGTPNGKLAKTLSQEDLDVHVLAPADFPGDATELKTYDSVIVSDVPAHLLLVNQVAALDTYVKDGGSLIIAGGEDSFGTGGYEATPLEKLMPVRFDSNRGNGPDLAVVLVIDRSGSMQGPKLEAAKESARVTAEVLSPSDLISVVVFDSEAQVFVRPQRAANRMRISTEIARLQSGGGTNVFPGLKEAFEILQATNANVKHVILLSDGEAPTDGIADLVADMRAANITVSAVGVQGADRNMLSMIADGGNGRLYMVEDLGALPKIFMKETQEAYKTHDDDLVHVRVAMKDDSIDGTDVAHAPALHGFVTTKPKPKAETILVSADDGAPILARWQYGAGTTVAWTSDLDKAWSADWIRWGKYSKFWAQVVRSTISRNVLTNQRGATK